MSTSAAEVSPFLAMTILERAQELEREGADIVHLEVGEPDFDVPACASSAAESALRGGATHYTHSLGVWELREAIAAHYGASYGVDLDPERVIVTTGTSGGLALLMALLLNPGDEVLLPDPGYACYPNFVRAFHGHPRAVPLAASDGYRYHSASLRSLVTVRTRALLVNSPANPTSAIQPLHTLRELVEIGVPVISDEIYHGLEYGPPAPSMLQATDKCFVLDGFSKRYAMTGLRVGWLVAPREYVAPLQRLQQNLFICAGSVAQHAALAALRDGSADVAMMRAEYARRRVLLLAGLRELGFGIPLEPEGAYYVLADARRMDPDSLRLARRILEEAHVGVAPGIDFGTAAEGHLRFSFASGYERIEEGLRRLRAWLCGGVGSGNFR
ncbi:MAG TPA: pyridoxal phosphate-dependent aminotransferase [Armatimonadota bacterium]|nr:pyridoxal phosphate-dependent aminotransferase [Armatimonadota bacterium]